MQPVVEQCLVGLTEEREAVEVVQVAVTRLAARLHEPGPFEPLIDRCITLGDGRLVADGPFEASAGGHEMHELPRPHTHPVGLEVV